MKKNEVFPEPVMTESVTGKNKIKNTSREYKMRMAEKPIYLCRV